VPPAPVALDQGQDSQLAPQVAGIGRRCRSGGMPVALGRKIKSFDEPPPAVVAGGGVLLLSLVEGVDIARMGIEHVAVVFHGAGCETGPQK